MKRNCGGYRSDLFGGWAGVVDGRFNQVGESRHQTHRKNQCRKKDEYRSHADKHQFNALFQQLRFQFGAPYIRKLPSITGFD